MKKINLFETKILDIINSYKDTDNQVSIAKKELDAAQDKYNNIGFRLSKKGAKLADGYMKLLCDTLQKKLSTPKKQGYGTLVEFYVDKMHGKVSIHNSIFRGNYEGISYFIRDERSLVNIRGYIPQKLTEKQAADFIIAEVKKFEKKNKTEINWFN